LNTEDDDSLVQFGGIVGDDKDDEVERLVIVMDKGLKQAPSDYVHTTLVHGNNNRMTKEFSCHPSLRHNMKPTVEVEKSGSSNIFLKGHSSGC
jgi:hypothetical protein